LKYQNRKLYDVSTSSYVNYDELIEMVKEGFDLKVIEKDTSRDITDEIQKKMIVHFTSNALKARPWTREQLKERLQKLAAMEMIQVTTRG
jgi:hypothetical protein